MTNLKALELMYFLTKTYTKEHFSLVKKTVLDFIILQMVQNSKEIGRKIKSMVLMENFKPLTEQFIMDRIKKIKSMVEVKKYSLINENMKANMKMICFTAKGNTLGPAEQPTQVTSKKERRKVMEHTNGLPVKFMKVIGLTIVWTVQVRKHGQVVKLLLVNLKMIS